MLINKDVAAAAEAWQQTRTDEAEINLDRAITKAGLMNESGIDEISPSDYGPYVGILFQDGDGLIINFATGEITAHQAEH